MEKEIEKTIRETLVISNPQSIHRAVKKILLLFSVVGQREQLPCEHPYDSIIGEEHENPKCLKCGENL